MNLSVVSPLRPQTAGQSVGIGREMFSAHLLWPHGSSWSSGSMRPAPNSTEPHCTAMHRITPHRTTSHRTVLYRTASQRSAPHRTAPHLTSPHAPHRTVPHLTAPHRTAPHRTSPHGNPPHRTATCVRFWFFRFCDSAVVVRWFGVKEDGVKLRWSDGPVG